jgi:hypothetical protein
MAAAKATGVCCAVGGIRYSPSTENEKQTRAFDKIDDDMSYDEWKEITMEVCERVK